MAEGNRAAEAQEDKNTEILSGVIGQIIEQYGCCRAGAIT